MRRHPAPLALTLLALWACSDSDPQPRLFAGNACPEDAGMLCPGAWGGAGGAQEEPEPEPEPEDAGRDEDADQDADQDAGQASYSFGAGLTLVDGERRVVISNCPSGARCASAPFTITNEGEGPGLIVVSASPALGTLDPACDQILAPDQSCTNTLSFQRPTSPATVQCLGRLLLSAPVSGQDTIAVCVETTFGECLSANCP